MSQFFKYTVDIYIYIFFFFFFFFGGGGEYFRANTGHASGALAHCISFFLTWVGTFQVLVGTRDGNCALGLGRINYHEMYKNEMWI